MVKEIIAFVLEPLMNQRGQYIPTPLGVSQPAGGLGVPGSAEETREYSPFTTSAPPAEWKDLIARYQTLLSGGAGGYAAFQDLQRNQMLERIRNLGASKGFGGRSGVTLAAQSRALGEFEPRAARESADYIRGLIGDYGTAVGQGRETRQPLLSKATRQEGPTQAAGGAGAFGGSPFQFIPSNPYGGGGGGSAVSSRGGSTGSGDLSGGRFWWGGEPAEGWRSDTSEGSLRAPLGSSFGGGDSSLIGSFGSATSGQSQYYDPLSGNYDLARLNEDYRRSMGF